MSGGAGPAELDVITEQACPRFLGLLADPQYGVSAIATLVSCPAGRQRTQGSGAAGRSSTTVETGEPQDSLHWGQGGVRQLEAHMELAFRCSV